MNDIKEHRFFRGIVWEQLLAKKNKPEYIPPLKYPSSITPRGMDDTRHFSKYPDSDTKSPAVKRSDDPFADW